MIDHVSYFVEDVERSSKFYDAVLRPLGIRCVLEVDQNDKHWHGYGYEPGKPLFWIGGPSPKGNHLHWAFTAKSRAEVDAFYKEALAAGAKDNGAPGPRPHGYAAFVIDPDAHNVEVVYRDS